jgi:hypothetical protein
MAVDPAFAGAGQAAGLTIWRIENKQVVSWPAEKHGKFHQGDSYIVLHTKQKSSGLEWDIHFWLGSESSQDEIGICAYKTVELDESLGGGPVQYREVEGHESQQFLSLFKRSGGIEYVPGGVESGFAHVERDVYETRLLHLKGARTVRCKPVPVNNSSLCTGDVFILDMGLKLFLWNGGEANRKEKAKGAEMLQKIKNEERGGRADLVFMDEDPQNGEFWGALGGFINVTNPGDDDEAAERHAREQTKLLKISDASGSLQVDEIPLDNGKLLKSQLDTNDVFIVDADVEIFVWIGRGATAQEKREGMIHASNYLTQANKPAWTPISRVVEGAETPVFKGFFFQWDPPRAVNFGATPAGVERGIAAAREQKAIDFSALHSGGVPEEETMVDDGTGQIQIWRIENFDKVPVPEDTYGQFYGGDSYVMLYTYEKRGAVEYIIYFWQGNESSNDEKGASALKAKELDDELGDRPVQVRVVQGKEPPHFRQLFKGRMIVHAGGKASGFTNRNDTDSYDTDGISLFHVKGSGPLNTYAVQVEERCSSLNSGDCFVLLTPSTMYVWNGSGANESEREVAANIADILKNKDGVNRQVVALNEGQEPDEFWTPLGGKTEYSQFPAQDEPPREPRLFQCSNVTGAFEIEEVFNFTQEDLCDDDVMLLDTYNTVYVWVGSQSNQQEKDMAFQAAADYIAHATDGRDPDTSIIKTKAGAEPPMFTMHFIGWDPQMAEKNKFIDPYQERLRRMRAERGEDVDDPGTITMNQVAAAGAGDTSGPKRPFSEKLTLDEIKSGAHDNLDPANKEKYLSDSEFVAHLGCQPNEFDGLPGWKKKQKKQSLGIW